MNAAAPEQWDVIVVGAGPGGSVAACELARLGLRTLLVEKSRFPRAKPCGCCLSAVALDVLEQIGLGDVVWERGAQAVTGVDIRAGGACPAGLALALKGGAVLPRSQLDEALVQAAVERGAVFSPEHVAKLGTVDSSHRMVHVHSSHGERVLRARVVIAADGLAGTLLRDESDFQPTIAPASRMGAAVTLAADAGGEYAPGVIWMTCGSGGYVGVVRLKDGRVHVAAALDPGFMRACGGPGQAAQGILDAAGRPRIEGLVDGRWRGTPSLMRTRKVEGERVLVIGDAARYVEPFTGEGMAWAMAAGAAAAQIAGEAARGADVAGKWTREHGRLIGRRSRLCRVLAWGLRRPRLARGAVRAASAIPAITYPALRALERREVLAARLMARGT